MADLNGCWYLVPMLGEGCTWVRTVRTVDGLAYAAGEDYVTTLRKSALSLMSAGWLGAFVS